MEKLDLTTPNITDENVQKIAELFPNCVTEADNGKTQVVDFDLLKQELSDNIVEGNKERYQLTWPGKAESLVTANTPINKTLRPVREESKDFNNTENLYIEGDNLEVLKLLQETYLGKIKMIYIDPPYNTGKDFVYKDNFTQDKAEYDEDAGNVDDEGGRLVSNPDSNGRYHSDWLSMMYPRLKLARNLLKDDGVIFISIDDNEAHNLRKVCDEIFGEINSIETFVVRSNPRGNQAKKQVASEHENILCFAKNKSNIDKLGFVKGQEEYNKVDGVGIYREMGLRKRGAGSRRVDAPNQFYPIYFSEESNEISIDASDNAIEIIPKLQDGSDGRWRWAKLSVQERGDELLARKVRRGDGYEYDIFQKDYYSEGKLSKIKSIFYDKGVNNENATEEVKQLFDNKKYFDYPKPTFTISKLVESIDNKDCAILDFFAGSGTTAHAVMQLNAEDGGNRKFIMAQIPETTDEKSEAYKAGYKTIAEIGKERIHRAGEKIKTDNADKEGVDDLDIGFRVLKVDSSNMKDVYFSPDNTSQDDMFDLASNIKDDRADEDLLFMVLLDWGIDLSVKIECREVAGKIVYFADGDFLAACFEDNLDEDFIKALSAEQPRKVVLRDSGFASSSVKINVEQIFKQANIEVKVI